MQLCHVYDKDIFPFVIATDYSRSQIFLVNFKPNKQVPFTIEFLALAFLIASATARSFIVLHWLLLRWLHNLRSIESWLIHLLVADVARVK